MMDHHEINLEQARIAHATHSTGNSESFKATIAAGAAALRTYITINAGAAIAILAFVGNIAGKDGKVFPSVHPFILPMAIFGFGVLSAAVALGTTYLGQMVFSWSSGKYKLDFHHPYVHETAESKRWHGWGRLAQIFSIALGVLSAALFIVGFCECISILRSATV
jgi:hypothetical protein